MGFAVNKEDEMSVNEVFEVFRANAATVEQVLAPSGHRIKYGDPSEFQPGDMTYLDHHALSEKIRKLAWAQTRKQVGERAWSRAMGAQGNGWRGAPTAAQRRAAGEVTGRWSGPLPT
jgi:hypothetical protein